MLNVIVSFPKDVLVLLYVYLYSNDSSNPSINEDIHVLFTIIKATMTFTVEVEIVVVCVIAQCAIFLQ